MNSRVRTRILHLAITLFAAYGTAAGQVSGKAIKNGGLRPEPLSELFDQGQGKRVATLYVMPGETMVFDDQGEPISGAGYYEAEPGSSFPVQVQSAMLSRALIEGQNIFALRVAKLGRDKNGRLTTIVGLRPLLE
jgi:hypothetical protein